MNAAEKLEVDMKNDYESRITRLETIIENMNHVLVLLPEEIKRNESKIDLKLEMMSKDVRSIYESVQKGFERTNEKGEKRHENLERKIEIIRSENWSQFRWILLFVLAILASPIVIQMIKTFHSN